MKIGFIGLGLMGSRMAAGLKSEGFTLSIFNRSKGAYQSFGNDVEKTTTAKQCADKCDVVFTMLSTPKVVEDVAFGPDGFLEAMTSGGVWVDCSTVSPSFSKRCLEQAIRRGLDFVEAPVAGSTAAATARQLVFLVGGGDSAVSRVTPLLNLMGKKVIRTGTIGSGSATKLLINYALASAMMNYAEIITAGKTMGLSNDFLFDQLPQFPVIAPFLQFKAPKLKSADFSAEFPLEWMVKDIGLLDGMLNERDVHFPMLESLLTMYRKGVDQGQSREDFSSVVKTLS